MKFICKKKLIYGYEIDDDLVLPELNFDVPFQGKVEIKIKKDDKHLCISLEVDGHEYF